jgi:hypothetical protein
VEGRNRYEKTNQQNERSVASLTLEKPDQACRERQLNVGGSTCKKITEEENTVNRKQENVNVR